MKHSTTLSRTSLICIEMTNPDSLVLVAALKNLQNNFWPTLSKTEFFQNFCRDCGYSENPDRIEADFIYHIQNSINKIDAKSVKLVFLEVEWELIWDLLDNLLQAALEDRINLPEEAEGYLFFIRDHIDINLFGSPHGIVPN